MSRRIEQLHIKLLSVAAKVPTRKYVGDLGHDIYVECDTRIPPQTFVDVPSGIAVAFPEGIGGRIVGRSSTLRSRGIFVSEGIVDQGWTGELFVGAFNLTTKEVVLSAGERIAQLILLEVIEAEWVHTANLPKRDRGDSGFGSTGA